MHIIETYALSCGLKIDKPYVFENYTTVPFDRFITFHKTHYPYFQEVLALIRPVLEANKIAILQIKAKQETVENGVVIFDTLNFGQWAYIMRHSMLHFGEDDFLFDLAGHYDIPRVIMFSNTFPTTTKPYWGSPEKEKILSSTGPLKKPSLSSDPAHNFVRFIKPEDIAASILSLLNIPWEAPYETVYPGQHYRPRHDVIELEPKEGLKLDVKGHVSNVAVRMDYNFDEKFLSAILSQSRATIITNKPINLALLQNLRGNINEIIYIVEQDNSPEFIENLQKLNLPTTALTFLNKEELISQKERFFEVCVINQITIPKCEDLPKLRDGTKGLLYKSTKRLFSKDKEFKSRHDAIQDLPSEADVFSPCPDVESPLFMKELEFFFLVKPLDKKPKIE